MKAKAISFYSKILSVILGALGFSSCETSSPDEYGTPSATYRMIGTVVTNETTPQDAIKAVAIRKHAYGDKEYYQRIDSVATSTDGKIDLKTNEFPDDIIFSIELSDTKTPKRFKDSIVAVDFKNIKFEGGKGWYKGTATKNFGTIKLRSVNDK